MLTVVKQLRVNGDVINAVQVEDDGMSYNVFQESLLNNVMFPALLEAGYKYVKMPYGFYRDNKMIDELPIESVNISDDELETMYNAIGRKLDMDELKSKMTTEVVKTVDLPPTHYTIHTREEFLNYLDLVKNQVLADDVMPINYFVAPEARFTLEEYRSLGFVNYVRILTDRRTMTLRRFINMLDKFTSIGLLPANYTAMDVVAAYMAWGLDGLNSPITNIRREFRTDVLLPSSAIKQTKVRRCFGLIDANGNHLLPPSERNNPWTPVTKDKAVINKIVSRLRGNQTALMEYETQAREEVIVIQIPQVAVQVSINNVKIANSLYKTMSVIDPTNVSPNLPIELCLPNAKERLYKFLMFEALAKDLYNSRHLNVNVSSYKALSLSGLDPRATLEYIFHNGDLAQIDFNSDSDQADGKKSLLANELETHQAIDKYLDGELDIESPYYGVITSIIDGTHNIDATQRGSILDCECNLSGVTNELMAIHEVLGLSTDDIYRQINSPHDGQDVLTFNGNGLEYNISITPLRNKVGGYSEDWHTYDADSAKDSLWMSYIIRVAKEVGIEEATRHIGIEFYKVNRTTRAVKMLMEKLVDEFENRVNTSIADAAQRNGLLEKKWLFACNRYFEIALKRTITWPKQLGGMIEPADAEDIAVAQKSLERKIESLPAYCEYTVNDRGHHYKLNGFCVNAQITTSIVIPRSGCKIKEAPFYALWYDYNYNESTRNIHNQLIDRGVFERGFIAWESRYASEQFKMRSGDKISSDPSSLSYIYDKAVEEVKGYPANREFISVHHPTEYIYPGLYDVDEGFEDRAMLPVPRDTQIAIRMGLWREITLEDYKEVLRPSEIPHVADSYIAPLFGISSDILLSVPDSLYKIPSLSTNQIMVHRGSKTIALLDTGETLDYTRIRDIDAQKYNIVQIIGNVFWFNDLFGKVWEVRV